MKVILQKDVKGVGRTGDILRVKKGFARNFLLPRQLALVATESKVKEWDHLQKMATIKKQKRKMDHKEVLDKVSQTVLEFCVEASEKSDKIFGSITSTHIVEALEKKGFHFDRKDIYTSGPIKTLGLHEVRIELGADLKTSLKLEVKAKKLKDKNDEDDKNTDRVHESISTHLETSSDNKANPEGEASQGLVKESEFKSESTKRESSSS